MKPGVVVAVVLSVVMAQAQTQKIDLRKDLPVSEVMRKKSPLAMLKDHEVHLKWSECVKLAPSVFASQKEVRGWVTQTWLHCLDQEQKKKSDPLILEKPLNTIATHPELFSEGLVAAELKERWVRLRLLQLEKQVQMKNQKAASALEKLVSGTFDLEKEQMARVFQALGDLAQLKLAYPEAQFFYEQAQNQKDSKYLQERLDFLLKIAGTTPGAKVPESRAEEVPGEEQKIEERIRLSLNNNEAVTALKDVMTILNQYPGSRTAKRLKDKPLEIYRAVSDSAIKQKALAELAEADSARLLEWAQGLHRRSDYPGALFLAKTLRQKSPSSPQVTSALWIGGRSAHFMGQYDLALEIFGDLIAHHAGTDEAAEALFRSSLIHYRMKNFSNTSALLERLLQQGRERYDLLGRYWLVRALQETNPERAQVAAAELIERYPFSYYGLRLRAEAQGGKFTWPEVPAKKPALQNEFYLVGDQKKTWRRFKLLSGAGWVSEAQSELAQLPFMKSPLLKVSLAQSLAARQQYATAIRLLNDAMEKDPRLRREEFVRIGYPEVFTELYKAEAERTGVQAILLRSLTRQESAFNLQAVSTSNALGLMQMIPPTAKEVAKKLSLKVELPDDMFRPEVNIPMGSFYVAQMLDQFEGNVPLALAAYNAGPNRIKTWLEVRPELREAITQPSSSAQSEIWFDELPWSETSFYVKAILRNVLLYRLVEEGSFTPKLVLWQDLQNKKSK